MLYKIKSPAKVNFGLFVINKREDGYHNIISIMKKIPFYDEMIIQENEILEISSNFYIPLNENIVYKTIKVVERLAGITCNLKIFINKHIPMGGGLGGGSSNAGVMLRFLNTYYRLNLSDEELIKIALSIGSDVPFFVIDSDCAIVEGRGEIVEVFNSNLNASFTLFFPHYPLYTKHMYEKISSKNFYFDLYQAKKRIEMIKLGLQKNDIDLIKNYYYNSFEYVLDEKIKNYLEILKKTDFDFVFLCGSGSSICLLRALKFSPYG